MQRDERAREACGALCAQLISSDLRKEFMDDNFRTTRSCAVVVLHTLSTTKDTTNKNGSQAYWKW